MRCAPNNEAPKPGATMQLTSQEQKESGWWSVVIYSIITSCRSRGIDLDYYIRDVLTRIPSMTNRQIVEITPEAWANQKVSSESVESRSA